MNKDDEDIDGSKVEPQPGPRQGEASESCPVVGIGASAGGLEACRAFFEAMPADSGIAFVVVLHLDPTRESMMASLLGKYTAMPVVEVQHGVHVRANLVYVIPPNTYIALHDSDVFHEPAVK